MKIELRQVSLRYGDKPPLFENVSAVFAPGDFVLIEGASGSGKSSLLRLLNRLHEPSGGCVLADDKPLGQWAVPALRRRVAYLQQTPVMLAGSVADNLAFPFRYGAANGSPAPPASEQKDMLERFCLRVEPGADASKLSLGQKQRLALIRLLWLQPDVLLCDEPTSALDNESRQIVEAEIARQNSEGRTVVVVTHVDFAAGNGALRRYQLSCDGGLQETRA